MSTFGAILRGHYEVPLVITEAKGDFKASLSRNGRELNYKLRWSGLDSAPLKAHIHLGKTGMVGGDILTLGNSDGKDTFKNHVAEMVGLDGSIEGTVSAEHVADVTFRFLGQDVFQGIRRREWAKFITALRNGYCYVNIHTETYVPPSGIIRGQIRQ
jgi:hypothetical protein